MRYSTPIRIIAMVLVLVLTWNSVSVGAVSAAMINQGLGVQTVTPNSNETSSGADSTDAATESDETEAEELLPVYENGTILLYTYEQLLLVGTGDVLRTQEGGTPVLTSDGSVVTYSADASYRVVQDIALPAEKLWQIPGSLTGRIAPAQTAEERPLYDAETDTIYIYNPYQLAVMAMDNAAEQPVMSNDANAATVGMGQLTILDDGSYLTYSPEHNYVISSQFDSELPENSYVTITQDELSAPASLAEMETESTDTGVEPQAETALGGPVFSGQVVKTVDGVQYIMLGAVQQVNAIGTGAPVYTAVYQKYSRQVKTEWGLDLDPSGNAILLYPGDTELGANETLSAVAEADEDLSQFKDILVPATYYKQGRAGVDQNSTGGTVIINNSDNTWVTGLTYSSSARYIIFRDIELTNKKWILPIDFSGEIVPAVYPTTRDLYNKDTGTLYIHNMFQLRAMYFSGKTATVVHANDAYVDKFGTGDVVKKADGTDLTYGDLTTKHVLSKYFGSAIPEGTKLDLWGRDFPGQVIKTVNGQQYILIGSELQMQKIGTRDEVWRPVYQWANDAVDTLKSTGAYIMRYPGDTDLSLAHNGYDTFTYHSVRDGDKSISNSGATTHKSGVNQETGEIDPDLDETTDVYYTSGANYSFVRDVPMTVRWHLPIDFTGVVVPLETPTTRELYVLATDPQSKDTLYIHNMFQLRAIYFSGSQTTVVHANDAYVDQFGTGAVVTDADGNALTYGDLANTNHVISKYFGSAIPEGTKLDLWGRDIPGQVLHTVNGEQRILLGNETQLGKIGTNDAVYRPIYQWVDGGLDNRKDNGMYIMRYPGDADLSVAHNGTGNYDNNYGDFTYHEVEDANSDISQKSGTRERAGVNQNTGAIDKSLGADTDVDYSNTAKYTIFRDIPLTGTWKLTEDFKGEIQPLNTPPEERTLYEVKDGKVTIYIHNPLQLNRLNADAEADKTVHANDAYAADFGTGDVVMVDGAPLTYSDKHNYVISQYFSTDIPEGATLLAQDIWGRDFPGQVLKNIDGEQYILIGNAEQLRAIGTDTEVYRPVYQTIGVSEKVEYKDGKPIMRYGGDADLLAEHNGVEDFAFHDVHSKKVSSGDLTLRGKAGVDQETGAIRTNLDEGTGVKYSSTANYIIFRDIDLNNEAWTPLMFSGTMIGVESPRNYTLLWDKTGNNATKIVITARPTISNIKVEQTERVEVTESMGIGFFATISNQYDTANIGMVGEQAWVTNLELRNVNVSTTTDETHVDQTVVSGLLSLVGGLLGGVLDGVIWLLTFGQVTLNLNEILSNLLNARAADPTALATGAFAGRIVGNVLVDKCAVTGTVQVNNVNSYTGGFVGYMEGTTEYDYLSQGLGGLVDVLAALLNVIPGLGLGDLITILLGNVIDVGTLIPTGYVEPKITNCVLSGLTGIVGNAQEGGEGQDFIGGFVGQEIGAMLVSNTITDSNYTVKANAYGGGFAGVARDAEVQGTLGLEDLVNLDMSTFQTQSLLMECDIIDSNVRVEGTQNLGGFVGVLANSYAINNTVDCDTDPTTGATPRTLIVSGTEKIEDTKTIPAVNVGGFAGYATLGWGAALGGNAAKKDTLLGAVSTLLMGLLGDNDKSAEQQQLLSLAGVAPSAILGCQMDFDSIEVSADGSYVGGMVGKADAVIMGKSDDEYMQDLTFWKYGNAALLTEEQKRENCSIDGLTSVTSGNNYAGGVAGYVGTANAGGLLDSTLGLARFIGFTVDGVTINGVEAGYDVSAEGVNAGGGFGAAVGGMVDNVQLNRLKSVTAYDRAAGFIGIAGPGDLVDAGGLQLSLLGLNILEINNLLAVGQGVEVEVTDSNVTGIPTGFTVEATGTRPANDDISVYNAAGFIASSNSTSVEHCSVNNLLKVIATNEGGYAGGFLGTSETGGLTEMLKQKDDEEGQKNKQALLDILKVNGLLNLVAYLIPDYESCTVSYVDGGGVQADVAGGFVANMQSGTVNNAELAKPYSVYNIAYANGQSYAGGFGGIVQSGALATAGKGLSILGTSDYSLVDLGIDATQVLSLVEAYVPFVKYAGVYSEKGFTVAAKYIDDMDINSGAAGGFIGFASGAQVSYSDVNALKNTQVEAPDNLEAVDAHSYFDDTKSTYAVTGARYAGGYFGDMDIGNAASLGGGLKILGESIGLTDILSVLSVVVTTVEHSDVYGTAGGFSVLADGVEKMQLEIELGDGTLGPKIVEEVVGMAGGFAGNISGGHVQDCNVHNFNYIIGQTAAGGYVGNMVPGNVAQVLDDASILSRVIDVKSSLATLLNDFVPVIRNSSTDAVPCGGAVRAHAPSDQYVQRGMAGGYAGHNEGGQIWGNTAASWKEENNEDGEYIGEMRPCEAIRIRSVYGYEYAGGFTGLMESADTAQVGGLSLLGDLVEVGNLLSVLKVVYPTEKNTAVYGPLAKMDYETWNLWVEYIGKFGGYGAELAEKGIVESQSELDEMLDDYIYGYNVVAGRSEHEVDIYSDGGDAGGYVGAMKSGVVTNAHANDVKLVSAMRHAGGFAGRMQTGALAKFGTVSLLNGLVDIDLGALVRNGLGQVLVPKVEDSSVRGYQSGMTVQATGTDHIHGCGYAGGFVGSSYGGQIWSGSDICRVENLRRVQGTNAIGGFVGLATAASVANVSTQASDGLLQDILDSVLGAPSDLISLLDATVTTIHGGSVSAFDEAWGFEIDGEYAPGKYANSAGGFAGTLEAAVLSKEYNPDETVPEGYKLTVNGLRSVVGGLYTGGFFGLADVTSVATVSGSGEDNSADILGLLELGKTDVLSAFRSYVYNATVNGVPEGFRVCAYDTDTEGIMGSKRQMGCAGGFGGGLMNGSVKDSVVNNLNTVEAPNYTGAFIGHMGKTAVADLDHASVADILRLANLNLGLLDIFGSHVDDCTLNGIADGYVIKAQNGEESIAGGFVGYADVGKINDSNANKLKKVVSDQIAGGFIGRTNRAYLIDLEVNSGLLEVLLLIVNGLLDILRVSDLENTGIIDVPPLEINGVGIFELNLLADGNLLYVNLLGIRIGVSISSENGNDRLYIHIGDSYISLDYPEDGEVGKDDLAEADLKLIKANQTDVNDCVVQGIPEGYDVFGGGATQTAVGTHANGHAGGFVGLNREGQFKRNEMHLCDTVRGTAGKVGPFSGTIDLQTVYDNYTEEDLEGESNTYRIYRSSDTAPGAAKTADDVTFASAAAFEDHPFVNYVFEVDHLQQIGKDEETEKITYLMSADLKDATAESYGALDVYQDNGATVVLMLNDETADNFESLVPEPGEMADPCEETIDLTIQKIWNDSDDKFEDRPDEITVQISQHYTLNGEYKKDSYGTPITLSAVDDGTSSTSIWRKVIEDLPVWYEGTDSDTGEKVFYYYSYTVEEITGDGYVRETEFDSFTSTSTIKNHALNPKPDTVVVDFGLPVDITPLINDSAYRGGTSGLKWIGSENETSYSGTYGVAEISGNQVRYTLNKSNGMQMQTAETFSYQGSYIIGENSNGEKIEYTRESTITVIPATTIYYEDDFVAYSSYTWDYDAKPAGWAMTESKWTQAGTTADKVQGEDRPGNSVDMPDADNIYGYDSAYDEMSEYSMGSAMKATVDYDNYALAEFSFYGTGFDVVSLTSNRTGTIQVIVKDASGATVKNHTVDTYYGYDYVDTNDDGVEDTWKVVTSDTENTLYQVPVMKVVDLPYGKYSVQIKARYATAFDHKQYGDGEKYDFYLDAIRIYDPANDGADNETIKNAYVADKEGWPLYKELRNLVLDANAFDLVEGDEVKVNGVVFIDGDAEVDDLQIKDYQSYGPNNELYLAKGQSIAFQLDAAANQSILADVQIGIKSADGKNVAYSICNVGDSGSYNSESAALTTATDMYYSIMDYYNAENHDPIVITNSGSDGVISITNIKFTFTAAPVSVQTPAEEATEAPAEAASIAGVNTYSLHAAQNSAAVMTASDASTAEESVVDAASFIYMTGNAATMTLRVLNHEAASYVAYNVNDDAYFTDLSDALSAAGSGETVQLVAGTAESVVIVPANVTFDLNGNMVEAGNVMSFGAVIDTAAEAGGIKIDIDETKAFTNLQPGNAGYLPIYDTSDGTYKFFAYELVNKGTKAAGGAAKFGIAISFENPEAYAVLAKTSDSGVTLKADLTWTDMSVPSVGYVIPVSAVKKFAESAYNQLMTTDKSETTYAITLTVSGLSNLTAGDFVAAAPSISTITGVGAVNEAIVYTIPET